MGKKSFKEWFSSLSFGKKILVGYLIPVVALCLFGIVAWGYFFIFQAMGCV